MKKIIAIFLSIISLICLVGCNMQDAVLDEAKTYEINSEIHSLDICVNAADFKIENGEELSVESNLKYLSVSEKDGVLTIVDEAKYNSNYSNPMLTICIPDGMAFEEVKMETGAAKLTVNTLFTNSLKLKLGAGDVKFESLNASSDADVKGGAGRITIVSGTINNLTLEMGAGELNLTAALLGTSNLKFGVGESNVTLLGGKDDYKVDIEKGLGNITVDGRTVVDFSGIGNGQNHLEIKGGIGAINVRFQ